MDYDTDQCVLHSLHSPVTVVNERHHPFPQEWQRKIWGKVLDNRTEPLCATGHNNVHAAINYYIKQGAWPRWCVGATRDLGEQAFALRAAALEDTPLTTALDHDWLLTLPALT